MPKTKWILDPAHSSVDFSVRHMMITNVKGTFHTFHAELEADPTDLTTANIIFSVHTSSVDTRNKDRDAHLVSADFFDAENYPTITFKATKIERIKEDEYKITGDFTLRGITKEETFVVTFEGQGKDPWGNVKAGFSATGTINRSDYGLVWNAALETGGVLVGDQVKINLQIQATKA
ncbi:YceI family protein [Neobacillus sedimentimangrovi]|jgi:polyisoprenoid-binding protein YceI|uniref:YceI family protein n=1 Tax=Neobacillus sedimentimangrovi TaxID=2699460 RepID=A0ABS8QMF2_9BACI|nr:YceI family protein [Neobacillus sedimentimangrovi]MCD4839875.1 YceI family protein [Neobacillus sedimentimangrovi]